MPGNIIHFADFELDPGAFQLRRAGRPLRLERIPLQLLTFLAERRGRVVTRDEILAAIWGKDVFVDADTSINTAVRKVRRALRDDPEDPRFVQTVPGKGYRFAAESRAMLAVLPFVNLSRDAAQEYFADGVTEEMITQLCCLDPQGLGVIARTSSMQYKATTKSAAQIAHELGVNYLLEGSIRREGPRVRVSAQLIRASDQTHLWAGNFDQDDSDVLRLQSDLALAISSRIHLTLTPWVRSRLAGARPVNAEAYQAYLLGLNAWELRTREDSRRSIAEFRRAIALEPRYAPPYAEMATVYSLASVVGLASPAESMPKAKEAAVRAIALDDGLAKGHTALAFVKAHYEFDWAAAEGEFRRAIELNPNDSAARFFFSNSFLSPAGRHHEAIAEFQKALHLDPLSAPMQSFFGQTLLWSRQFDAALKQYRECARLFPTFAINFERIAHLYTYMECFEEAIAAEMRARVLCGEPADSVSAKEDSLRKALQTEGPKGYWGKKLEFSRLPDNPPETYRGAYGTAIIYTRLGQYADALRCLQDALEARALSMTEIAIEPAFEPLRSHPTFQDIVRQIGLGHRSDPL